MKKRPTDLVLLSLLSLAAGLSSSAWAGPPVPAGDVRLPAGIHQPAGGNDPPLEGLDGPMYQVSTGPTGLYEIWSAKSTEGTSQRLGYLVVTGSSTYGGDYLKFHEHFIWNVAAKWPAQFYVKSSPASPTQALLDSAVSVDKFNNRIGCDRPGKEMSGDSQWEVKVKNSTLVHVANLIKKQPAGKPQQLLGYWKSSTSCKAIEVGTDGWMDFLRPSVTFTPKSSGTPTN